MHPKKKKTSTKQKPLEKQQRNTVQFKVQMEVSRFEEDVFGLCLTFFFFF